MTLTEDTLRRRISGIVQHINKYTPERGELYTDKIMQIIKTAHHQDIEEAVRAARIEELEGIPLDNGEAGVWLSMSLEERDRRIAQITKPEGKPLMRVCYENPIGTHVIISKPENSAEPIKGSHDSIAAIKSEKAASERVGEVLSCNGCLCGSTHAHKPDKVKEGKS